METISPSPDVGVVAPECLGRLTEAHLQGALDLAVEIVSESTRGRDEVTKGHRDARHGVPEYRIVDPAAEKVEIDRQSGGSHDVLEWKGEFGIMSGP